MHEILLALPSSFSEFILDVDMTETGPLPVVGIEIYPRNSTNELQDWEEVFQLLVKRGIAVPEKWSAIKQYLGISSVSDHLKPHEQWVSAREINCIKLTCSPTKPIQVKVYLRACLFEIPASLDLLAQKQNENLS